MCVVCVCGGGGGGVGGGGGGADYGQFMSPLVSRTGCVGVIVIIS